MSNQTRCTYTVKHTDTRALIQPHFCAVCSNTADKYVNKLQILQKRPAKIVLGCTGDIRDANADDLYTKQKWMKIRQLIRERSDYLYFKATMMYRYNVISNVAPEYLCQTLLLTQIVPD